MSKVTIGAAGTITPPAGHVAKNAERHEQQGFDTIWYPDHLMGWHPDEFWARIDTGIAQVMPNPHIFFDPAIAIALAAPATSTIRLGTSVTDAVRRPPAVLAQTFLSLHHASEGRVILGIGAGERENVLPYGIDGSRSVAKLDESLEIIKLLWAADGPVDYDGEFWPLEDAVLGLGGVDVPDRPRYPEIWVAAHGPRMLDICGRHGGGWIPIQQPVDVYAKGLAKVRAAAQRAGRDPAEIEAAMWGFVICDESHDICHAALQSPLVRSLALIFPASAFNAVGARHPLGDDFAGLHDYIPTKYSGDVFAKAVDKLDDDTVHGLIPHGTPEEIAGMVASYEAVGLEHYVPWNVTFYADLARVVPSHLALRELVRLVAQGE